MRRVAHACHHPVRTTAVRTSRTDTQPASCNESGTHTPRAPGRGYAHPMADEPTQMSDEQIELANQLFDFARVGETEKLAAYIDAGAPLEMRNSNGDTFLILAAYNGAPETVAMLIEKGAELETQNERGQNALTCAVFKQDVESATHLLKAGADPDAGTPTARDTAKMFAFTQLDELL